VASDILKATSPLVSKVLLVWLAKTYDYHRLSDSARAALLPSQKPQGVGYGIGLAIALFVMQGAFRFMVGQIKSFLTSLCPQRRLAWYVDHLASQRSTELIVAHVRCRLITFIVGPASWYRPKNKI
jgi:hypothetical protein